MNADNKAKPDNKVKVGIFGQQVAENFLRDKGMAMVAANFRAPGGEIDLIMKDDDYIVFVEVKYRRGTEYGLPGESVGARKQRRIKDAALYYVARYPGQDQDFRFDTVEILDVRQGLLVNHIENAFW